MDRSKDLNEKEAIAILKTLCHTCKIFPQCAYKKPDCFKAIEMAISALQAQDVPDINVGDMIFRQVAIDALDEGLWGVEWDKALATAILKDLPSAQQESEHTMEEFMYGQDLGSPEDGSL